MVDLSSRFRLVPSRAAFVSFSFLRKEKDSNGLELIKKTATCIMLL